MPCEADGSRPGGGALPWGCAKNDGSSINHVVGGLGMGVNDGELCFMMIILRLMMINDRIYWFMVVDDG